MEKQIIYFYLDDSGVFHKNANSNYFVYAGFAFTSKNKMENAKRKYRAVANKIGNAKGIVGEVKASMISNKHKQALYSVLKEEETLSAVVNINNIYDNILNNKKSIHRYKDYIIRRIVKNKIQHLILSGEINDNTDVEILIYIDEQPTSSNGFYDLKDGIFEELKLGISNFNYGNFYRPILHGSLEIKLQFVDSSKHYLVQASDILANRIFNSYRYERPEWRNIPNHDYLGFP